MSKKNNIPTGELIVPASYIRQRTWADVENVPFDERYPGLDKVLWNILQGQKDITTALDEVTRSFAVLGSALTMARISRAAQGLPEFLRSTHYLAEISGNMVRADNLVAQYAPDCINHPALVHLRGLVLAVTNVVTRAEKLTADQPYAIAKIIDELLQAMGEGAQDNCDRLVNQIKGSMNLGGRPEGTTSPIHEAIWKVGLSIYYQHQDKPDWCSKTTADIWKAICCKPTTQRNAAENLIYQEWKSKMGKGLKNDFKGCKNQVHYAFKKDDLGNNRL